jgi:hypothetical protein
MTAVMTGIREREQEGNLNITGSSIKGGYLQLANHLILYGGGNRIRTGE